MLTRLGNNLCITVFFWACTVAFSPSIAAADGATTPARAFPEEESLTYRFLWPSGVTLGEAVLRASFSGEELHLQLTVEADLPQYNISHSSSSVATREGICSLRFQTETSAGPKTSAESIEFDQSAHLARRTLENQTTSASIPECARDPLAFLYYFRSQLAAGTTLDSGTFHFGSNYSVQIKAEGPETVEAGGRQWSSRKYVVTYRGPNSGKTFELWISTEPSRKPVRVRVSYPLAVFSAEIE